jgi:hypothetical protein
LRTSYKCLETADKKMNENTMKNELETCDKIETNMTRRYCRISAKISENLRDTREMQWKK